MQQIYFLVNQKITHQSIIYTAYTAYLRLEPIPVDFGRKEGHTLSIYCIANTETPMGNLE